MERSENIIAERDRTYATKAMLFVYRYHLKSVRYVKTRKKCDRYLNSDYVL